MTPTEIQEQAISRLQRVDPRATLLAQGVSSSTIDQFVDHHRKNPEIWREFERFTLRAVRAGRQRLGAKAIMERVRWETEVEGGVDWKCNNSYTAYYARMFAAKYPEAKNMFEFRTIKGLKE
jgi:hypothetical protein